MSDTDRRCANCGSTEHAVLQDGFALVPIEITIADEDTITGLLGGCCWQPVVNLLVALGRPYWQAFGWRTEADAIAEGWDPEHPERYPFDEED